MASTAAVQAMSKRPPQGYTDLKTAVGKAEGSMLKVIGVVSDWMPPGPTRGDDFQMTFTLNDTSVLANGFRVKFFRKEKDLPFIRDAGDVVLLRNIKLKTFNGGANGLSSYATEHIVFPRDSIVSPELRVKYMVHGNYLRHYKSDKADNPSIEEQQWVITLHDQFRSSYQAPSSAPSAPRAMRSDAVRKTDQPTSSGDVTRGSGIIQQDKETRSDQLDRWNSRVTTQKDKFSLLKDVHIVDKGCFYDLIGEVVKLFYNTYSGVLELYLTDYTSNSILRSFEPELDDSGHSTWLGPTGKMVLQVELSPPHSLWAQANVSIRDFVLLKNVRVKYNNRAEAVGTMWLDQYYPDKVSVYPLNTTHPQYTELVARKQAYDARTKKNASANGLTNSQMSKGQRQLAKAQRKRLRKEKRERKKKARKESHARDMMKQSNEQTGEMSNSDNDYEPGEGSDSDSHSDLDQPPVKQAKTSKGRPSSRYIINSNVISNFPDIPLSTFSEILHNPLHMHTTPNGTKYELPFINVRHRAQVRVVDYYPHRLRDFCKRVSNLAHLSEQLWQWDFWLVLQSDSASEDPAKECMNCHVTGADAEELLGLQAQDLTRPTSRRALDHLDQTLFLLWGELAEKKDAFLAAHPHITPDADFSAVRYHIRTDALPIEVCIAEFGVEVEDIDGEGKDAGDEDVNGDVIVQIDKDADLGVKGARKRWERVYKLFGTHIDR